MLILTRRIGEVLVIDTPGGEKIEITVLGVKGNQVRIGTSAPMAVTVVREELLEREDYTPPLPYSGS